MGATPPGNRSFSSKAATSTPRDLIALQRTPGLLGDSLQLALHVLLVLDHLLFVGSEAYWLTMFAISGPADFSPRPAREDCSENARDPTSGAGPKDREREREREITTLHLKACNAFAVLLHADDVLQSPQRSSLAKTLHHSHALNKSLACSVGPEDVLALSWNGFFIAEILPAKTTSV